MKLNETVVSKIKDDLILGRLTQQQIAEKYSTKNKVLSRSLISNIATGRQYRDVGPAMDIPKNRSAGRTSRCPEQEAMYWQGQAERLKLQLNQANRKVRDFARFQSAVDYMVEEISEHIRPIKPPKVNIPRKRQGKKKITESAVLMLSDMHADEVVNGEEVDWLESYNFEECVLRACHLVSEVKEWCARSLQNFEFDELVIFGLGDYTNGEIHRAENYFQNQMTADLAIGELIGCMVADLSESFPHVRFCNVTGNHGRKTDHIEFDKKAVQDNHDTLIVRIAELYCRDIENVTFQFPDSVSTICSVQGFNFHLSHGHGKKLGSSVWNRSEAYSKNLNSIHKGSIDYFCTGHYHTPGDVEINGATLLANGAWLGTDQYAYQSLSVAGTPSQTLFGVHHVNGVTWRLPLNLREGNPQVNRYLSLARYFK